MIEFIGGSLRLQSIERAHTLNSLTTSDESLRRISHCCLNLGLVSTTRIHETTLFYNFHTTRIEVTASKGSISVLHECIVSETVS
jgi:hypothetical protein